MLKKVISFTLAMLMLFCIIPMGTLKAAANAICSSEAYNENGTIHIIDSRTIDENHWFEYRIGTDGTWLTAQSKTFDVVSTVDTTIYIRYAESDGSYSFIAELDVNRTIGEYSDIFSDLAIEANVLPMGINRYYSSFSGWNFSYMNSLLQIGDEMLYSSFTGENTVFYLKNGQYVSDDNRSISVYEDDDGNMIGVITEADTSYHFNVSSGHYTKIVDNGKITTFSWYQDRLIITDPASKQYTVMINSNGKPVHITAPSYSYINDTGETVIQTKEVSYTWNDNQLTSFTDAMGITHTYEYSNGLLSAYDGKNIIYTSDGRVTKVTNADGSFTSYQYDDTAVNTTENQSEQIGCLTVSDSSGANSIYRYNGEYVDSGLSVINADLPNSTIANVSYAVFYEENSTEDDAANNTDVDSGVLYEDDGIGNYKFYEYDDSNNIISMSVVPAYNISGEISEMTYEQAETVADYLYTYTYNSNNKISSECVSERADNGNLRFWYSQNYSYDSTGNVSSYTKYVYNANDGYNYPAEQTTYTYDAYGNVATSRTIVPFDVIEVETNTRYTYNTWGQLVYSYEHKDAYSNIKEHIYRYDNLGRLIYHKETNTAGSYAGTGDISIASDPVNIENEYYYTYDNAGNVLCESVNGETTTYTYSSNRLVSKTDADGNTMTYTYDAYANLLNKTFNGYTMNYSASSGLSSVSVGGTAIASNQYDTNGNLSNVVYGNGQNVSYEYNDKEAVTKIKNGANTLFEFTYNEETGECTQVFDVPNSTKIVYNNDSSLVSYYDSSTDDILYSVKQNEKDTDDSNSFNGTTLTLANGESYSVRINRDSETFVKAGGNTFSKSYTYNYYDLLDSTSVGNVLNTFYSYNTNQEVSAMTHSYNGGSQTFVYVYNENGNISAMTDSYSKSTPMIKYTYDEKNQLVRVDDVYENATHVYSYDERGNILSKEKYAYTTESLVGLSPVSEQSFSYSDSGWADKLTAYNGDSIIYDAAGNPINYLGHTLSWTRGRMLASYDTNSYVYNADGIRTKKTVGDVTTEYYLDGAKILGQYDGNNRLIFQYDRNDSLVGFVWNGAQYYYVKNLLGDITAVLDATGNCVVNYTYDAWGKVLTVTGDAAATVGQINPFRYRGYYYDAETQFYYLQSRYYDPEIGRFINSDDVHYLGISESKLSYNAFAYCGNNPINDIDPTGYIALLTCVLIGAGIGLLVGGASGIAISYLNFGYVKWKYVIVGSIFGVAVGAIAGYGVGVAIGATTSTTLGLSSQASYLAKNVSKLKFSNTIKGYAKTRKYYNYNSLIKQIINSATPVKDGANALKWIIPGTMNGTKGVWELVINPSTKVIYHFLFNSKR